MANHTNIIPFIRRAEGGWVNDPDDAGGETNAGITYTVWQTFFGDTHERFMAMNDEDWGVIFKKGYWDQILGDSISSQRNADIIVDWVWCSGKHYPEADIQDILIHSFGQHIAEDGDFGPATINALNISDESSEWNDIVAKRLWYVNQLCIITPTNTKFKEGWVNRINNLVTFENSGELV